MQDPDLSAFRARLLEMIVLRDAPIWREEEIFAKTGNGRAEVADAQSRLPRRLFNLLLLVDGRRSVADFRSTLTRFRSLDECFDMLLRKGYIEPLAARR
jgi:hypothetical protein